MLTPLIILFMVAYSGSHPLLETTLSYALTTEIDHHVDSLQRDVNLVSYIQNFKQVMAQYVNSQYNNLTIDEMEKVKMTLEEFLQNFATDLRDTIENKNNDDQPFPDDGINDEMFAEIKRKIVIEFPDVTDDVANKIIVKLRKNLYATRSKLEHILRESHNAAIENSE